MKKNTLSELRSRMENESTSTLDEILHEGARRMLRVAIEAEVVALRTTRKFLMNQGIAL